MLLGEHYDDDRPPYSWALVILGIWGLACLLRGALSHLLLPLWIDWTPGPMLGNWVLRSPMRQFASDVSFFCLYIPDCITTSCVAAILATVFFRHWIQLTMTFALAFFVVSHAHGGFPTEYALGSVRQEGWSRATVYGVFTLIILGHLLMGGWVGAKVFAKRPPEGNYCARCGYSLRGLPRHVCPECGQHFVPPINDEGSPKGRGAVSQHRSVPSLFARTPTPYRFIASGILLALFYICDWTALQVLVRTLIHLCCGVLGLSVHNTDYAGVPAIGVEATFFQFTAHCTSLDVILILAPFVWRARSTPLNNLFRLVALGAAAFGVNLVRIGIAIYLNVLGMSWEYTHDVPYVLLYSMALMVVVRVAILQDRKDLEAGIETGPG